MSKISMTLTPENARETQLAREAFRVGIHSALGLDETPGTYFSNDEYPAISARLAKTLFPSPPCPNILEFPAISGIEFRWRVDYGRVEYASRDQDDWEEYGPRDIDVNQPKHREFIANIDRLLATPTVPCDEVAK